jgi:hypothetical protein
LLVATRAPALRRSSSKPAIFIPRRYGPVASTTLRYAPFFRDTSTDARNAGAR